MSFEPIRDYVGEAMAHREREGGGHSTSRAPATTRSRREQDRASKDSGFRCKLTEVRNRERESQQREHPNATEPQWQLGSFTAKQLQEMKFPPTSFLVQDIILAEGVTLLCSKPKFGKSWLAYDLCIGCTMNRIILGEILPAQGDALYLALEDSKRRLQRRMSKLLPAGTKWPTNLTLKTEWRRLQEGGLDDIRAWHAHSKVTAGSRSW